MKFTCQVDINLPREKVVKLWDDPENLVHWQDDFMSFEHVSGQVGQTGALSKMTYKQGKGKMILHETILENTLPDSFRGRYVHEKMTNTMSNRFEKLGENKTRWTADLEYEQFNGLMMKIMAKLFAGKFKSQTQKWLDQFKVFAEGAA